MNIEREIERLTNTLKGLLQVVRGDNGALQITGKVHRIEAGVDYSGGIFVPLATPLTSTDWDGDAHSTTAKTLIDLSAVFGAPAGIKAVLAKVGTRDSGSAAGSAWLVISPNATTYLGVGPECSGKTNDTWAIDTVVCPCDANGDIYYQCVATGAGTLDVIIETWGYWV